METAFELDLTVDHSSVREARRFVAIFDGAESGRLVDAQLVVSELVTNALEHAALGPADSIRLRLCRLGSRLRIDVDDAGTFTADSDTFAYPRRGRHHRGRGLRVVQALQSAGRPPTAGSPPGSRSEASSSAAPTLLDVRGAKPRCRGR